jgi:hypothetical protein
MWYRDFFKQKKEETIVPVIQEKPPIPEELFDEYVEKNIPESNSELNLGNKDHHLIITGTGNLHSAPSHSTYIGSILDKTREQIQNDPEIAQKYNLSKMPEFAYGPEDLIQSRNQQLKPTETPMRQEDAVTEIINRYFDQGIRISYMAGTLSINAVHDPNFEQIKKIQDIIKLLAPKNVKANIKTPKGHLIEEYNQNNIDKLRNDMLHLKVHGTKTHSGVRNIRNM